VGVVSGIELFGMASTPVRGIGQVGSNQAAACPAMPLSSRGCASVRKYSSVALAFWWPALLIRRRRLESLLEKIWPAYGASASRDSGHK